MKETKYEDVGLTANRQPSYSHSYTEVNNVNDYLFMTHTYEGSGGYRDGAYLVPFAREAWYENRKTFSTYRNYIKPIIDAMITPVFSNPISRELIRGDARYNKFIENSDNRGNSLTSIIQEAVKYARLHGVSFIVMDNMSDTADMTLQQQIDERILPYLYIQTADSVANYATDKFNKLTEISFKGQESIGDEKYVTIVTWSANFYIKEWYDGDKFIRAESFQHDLGILPIIPVMNDSTSSYLPTPPMYSLAKLNLGLYNKDSELRDQERAQAFSVFYIQHDTNNSNLTIGPHNAISLPVTPDLNITPGYASPDSSVLKHIMDSCQKYIDSIYASAEQHGISVQATSGIEQAYKFHSTAQQLKHTARIAHAAEIGIVKVLSAYLSVDIEVTIKYTTEYTPYYDNLTIDEAQKALEMNLPNSAKVELKKALVGKLLNHLETEELNIIHQDIEDMVQISGVAA